MRRLAAVALLAAAAGCSSKVEPTPPDPPSRTATTGMEEAVVQLGDDDCAIRRKAAEDLIAAGRESLPYLERARASSDPEVRTRALELTEAIESQPLVWVGTHDDRWENPENWNPKQTPTAWSVAIIPEATDPLYAPSIRGQVEVRDLVLLRRSELTVEETARLKVTGRLRSRGVLRALGVVQSDQ